MDVDLTISEITPEEEFTVNVTLKDLATGNELSGSSVKITFQGTEETDTTGTFTAPKYSGEYTISVEVTKDGYSVINAKSWLQVGEVTPSDGDGDNGDDKKKDDDKGFLPGFDSIIIISLLIVVIINIKWLSRNRN